MINCNLCGCLEFTAMGLRQNVKCKRCGSLERTRLLWMYLQNAGITPQKKLLHFAPERGLYNVLSQRLGPGMYITADIEPERFPFAKNMVKLDLCDLEAHVSREYDLIIHSHVLEHTPCNIAYTLFHLHRMLKDDGQHICVIPFAPGRYDESFQMITDQERMRRFGQFDHVRRFGSEDVEAHLGKLLNLRAFDATADFSEEDLRMANVPENCWRGFNANTVLQLKKSDMRLLSRR